MEKTLFLFKKAYSLVYPDDHYEAVLVSGGRIERLLKKEEAARLAASGGTSGVRIADYSGCFCYPGFFDSHVHFMQTGYNKLTVRLFGCESSGAMLARIGEAVSAGGREVVVAHGFDESLFADRRIPTKSDLDAVSRDIPIVAGRVDHHSCVVNTAFIKKFRSFFATLGAAERETGVLRREANYRLKAMLTGSLDDSERLAAFERAGREALETGVTTLCALEGGNVGSGADARFVDRMIKEGRPGTNILLFNQTTDCGEVLSMGLPRIGGCVMVDGSIGSMTAALGSPYRGTKNSGSLYFERGALADFVERSHSSGLQIACHAIGDRAISLYLDCLESVIRKSRSAAGNDLRHRIEHFEMATARDIRRAADLGVILSMQPAFETAWGGPGAMYEKRLGKRRMSLTNRFRTICEAGGVIAGGSDSDVTPMSPLGGIAALLGLPNEDERPGAFEALSIFTRNGAYANFLERTKGTLAPGKDADFSVADVDIPRSSPESIRKASIAATVVGGRVLYESGALKKTSRGESRYAVGCHR